MEHSILDNFNHLMDEEENKFKVPLRVYDNYVLVENQREYVLVNRLENIPRYWVDLKFELTGSFINPLYLYYYDYSNSNNNDGQLRLISEVSGYCRFLEYILSRYSNYKREIDLVDGFMVSLSKF